MTRRIVPGTRKTIDIAGERFGRLVVLRFVRVSKTRKAYWLCRCDCGREACIQAGNLRTGHTVSCGCYHRETAQARATKHGQRGTPEWLAWAGMTRRCRSESDYQYQDYGGRGIRVCDRWLGVNGFANFLADMGSKPSAKHSLDRFPDKNGGYCPENCRWATRVQQARNRRSNTILECGGESLTLAEWSERTGIKPHTIMARIRRHRWTVKKALGM